MSSPHHHGPEPAPAPDQTRNVLVTGASRGIGRAIATSFAQNGDRVIVHHHTRREEAEHTLAHLPGKGHFLLQADLADPQATADLFTRVLTSVDHLHVLVNNAAVNLPHPLTETSYTNWQDLWRRTMDTNVLGAANASYLAARHMIDQGIAGRIVNVGSRGAYRGEPDHPAYGASKAALHSLGQSLAVALAPYGIGVASVAPGFVRTERVAHRLTDAVRADSPFGRVASPEEVADAVLHLASPRALWSSGAVLDVNGASYLR